MTSANVLGVFKWTTATVVLAFSLTALAQDPPSACMWQGALAYDNWTKEDSGGTGELPDGAQDSDYVRCKACHGWDRMGIDGGYVRRTRTEGRPNAGAGDADPHHRNITLKVFAPFGLVITESMILHQGPEYGRSFEDGMGSWVERIGGFGFRDAYNWADWARGYTLVNQHPDFTTGGDNALTQAQVDCLVEFLNSDDAQPDTYFDNIWPHLNPVLYDIVDTADADAGETYYGANCSGCHGDPATDHQGANNGNPEGGILAYLAQDGKFSEFAHKVRWGIPDTIMSRGSMGEPTAAEVADMMLYLQELGGTGFYITEGITGTWFNRDRDGEGFNVDVIPAAANGAEVTTDSASNGHSGATFLAFFYTYDDMGNQVYLVAIGTTDGNVAEVDIQITDGAMWGDAFDKDDVVRTDWGTGTFIANSCGEMSFMLTPNDDMKAMGFTDLAYDLVRLTVPVACP